MNLRSLTTVVLTTIFLLAGCGGDTGGPGGGGGGGHPFTGHFVARGTGYMHAMDLTNNGEWMRKITAPTSYSEPYLDRSTNELYLAELNALGPMFITVYDAFSYAQKRRFTWPLTEDLWRVREFAVAPAGKYMAARIEGVGPEFLEVIDAESEEILTTLYDFEVESNLLWTSAVRTGEPRLVLAIESPESLPVGVHAAIIAIPLSEFLDPDDALDGEILRAFNEAEWGQWGVSYLALSEDETQVAYVLDGDIWVKNLVDGTDAYQLTAGPSSNSGPAFSPDGTLVAFIGDRSVSGSATYIVPNDRAGPYFVDLDNDGATQAYLLDSSSLVDVIMAWLP